MRIVDIILKKRYGQELTTREITELVQAYTLGEMPDYQMAAWLMAVCFSGMTDNEVAALTIAMAQSGNMIDLSSIPGVKVDKHSTGGVADTTTLVVAPLVAAAGVPVAKMSGRGLGFTGGTIDKLESIPGFCTELAQAEFIDTLRRVGLAVNSQTENIAPADGKIYALRDVTGTVESIPLIASSIMSKKIAAGADKILLDVKTGSGAFMKTIDEAIKLATAMVKIGKIVGKETRAIITSMDQPLGRAVGNSLEVMEAIELLNGKGKSPELQHVCLTLGSHMLMLAGIVQNETDGCNLLTQLLDSKQALAKLAEFITAQGGDGKVIHNFNLLPTAAFQQVIFSTSCGYVNRIDTAEIGRAAMILGAGREYKNQAIDLAAGLIMECRIGDYVEEGQALAAVYTNNYSKIDIASEKICQAIQLDRKMPEKLSPLIIGIVNDHGFYPVAT